MPSLVQLETLVLLSLAFLSKLKGKRWDDDLFLTSSDSRHSMVLLHTIAVMNKNKEWNHNVGVA